MMQTEQHIREVWEEKADAMLEAIYRNPTDGFVKTTEQIAERSIRILEEFNKIWK